MRTFKRHAAKAILVIMVANSCLSMQAFSWSDCSQYVCNKVSRVYDVLKKPKVLAPLAALAGALYMYKQVQKSKAEIEQICGLAQGALAKCSRFQNVMDPEVKKTIYRERYDSDDCYEGMVLLKSNNRGVVMTRLADACEELIAQELGEQEDCYNYDCMLPVREFDNRCVVPVLRTMRDRFADLDRKEKNLGLIESLALRYCYPNIKERVDTVRKDLADSVGKLEEFSTFANRAQKARAIDDAKFILEGDASIDSREGRLASIVLRLQTV